MPSFANLKMERRIIFFVLTLHFLAAAQNGSAYGTAPFHVGVVLDLGTLVGKIGICSISMALDDFYSVHINYRTRLVLHKRDSNNDAIQAASKALNLLENTQVEAIIGPQKSGQAVFVSDIGSKSQVPIISFSATSPSLSSVGNPYFVRTTLNDSSQVNAILSIIKAFKWREVVPVYEDTDYGRGVVPYFVDALQEINVRILYRSAISLLATDDQIMEELYKLMTMQTRVFIVHMSPPMGIRLFSKAKEVGMMSEGYVWIMTDGLTNMVDSFDLSITDSMQGALGVKLYVPKSREHDDFKTRWKRKFRQDNPDDEAVELSNFGLWAYDTVWALAKAVEKVGPLNSHFHRQQNGKNSMVLEAMPISMNGPNLLKAILEERFRGLSGEFHLIDGQLQSSTFQIINVVGRGGRDIGFWTPENGISRQPNPNTSKTYSTSMTDLNPIIWPGESTAVPRGWEIPTSGNKLRIGVPVKNGFRDFVNVVRDPLTNLTNVTGYCIDIFEAVVKILPYAISYEYFPFENAQGQMAGTYDNLVYQVHLQKYDAVVGDVTIRGNRTAYVDFTVPYTESGVSMLVPVKESANNNAWIFLRPLTVDLWLSSFAFFIFTGFVVWVMEHRINAEFRGPPSQQLGLIFYFAHRAKLVNVLSQLVIIVWVFVVLILTSSYTASLTSIITMQQLQPTFTDVQELLKNGKCVGFNKGSFVEGLLKQLQFGESKIRAYSNPDDYFEALSNGSKNGGVSAIIDEVPYIKPFLAQRCTGYTMVGPIFKTAGFGFVFPKGSPLVPDISRAILNITEGDMIAEIEKKWFGDQTICLNQGSTITSNSLSFQSFWGLFLITGTTSTCALFIFLAMFFYKNWHELMNMDPDKPIWRRLIAWSKYYNKRDLTFYTFKRDKSMSANGGVNINCMQAPPIEDSTNIASDVCSSVSKLSDLNACPQEDGDTSTDAGNPNTNTSIVSIIVSS